MRVITRYIILSAALFLIGSFRTNGSACAQVRPDSVSSVLLRQSIEAVLGTDSAVTWNAIPLSANLRAKLRDKQKRRRPLPDTLFVGFVPTDAGPRYVIPDEAPSRTETFSFVLYLDENWRVVDVDVIKYRENYGAEIDYPLFRKQFKNKSRPKDIVFRRSIQNISGATISARSITYAVHDLLVLMSAIDPLQLSTQ